MSGKLSAVCLSIFAAMLIFGIFTTNSDSSDHLQMKVTLRINPEDKEKALETGLKILMNDSDYRPNMPIFITITQDEKGSNDLN